MSKAEFISIIAYDVLGAGLFYGALAGVLYAFIRRPLVMFVLTLGLMALGGWLIFALLYWPRGFYLY